MCSLLVKTAMQRLQGSVGAACWKIFVVLHESSNHNDRLAMAVYRDEDLAVIEDSGVIVGRLPREIYVWWRLSFRLPIGRFGRLGSSIGWYRLRIDIAETPVPRYEKATCKIVSDPSSLGGRSINSNHFFHFVRFSSHEDKCRKCAIFKDTML